MHNCSVYINNCNRLCVCVYILLYNSTYKLQSSSIYVLFKHVIGI